MSSYTREALALGLIEPREMGRADQIAVDMGTRFDLLVEKAGKAVADCVAAFVNDESRIAVLAGPGNNGEDAAIAARALAQRHAVTIFKLDKPVDDAANREIGAVPSMPLSAFDASGFDLVIDGLFGAGLNRPVEEPVLSIVRALNESPCRVVSIDIPSGVQGATGAVLGAAVEASTTITFVARKPGHLLMPGRQFCGEVVVADIGMPEDAISAVEIAGFANEPALWIGAARSPARAGHKYDRGHAVIFSGDASRTGAARMAASGALRGGAGLVTVFSPASAILVNAMHLTAIMLKRCTDSADLDALLEDERFNAFVLGPGFGIGDLTRDYAKRVLSAGRQLVLDADGLSSFAEEPESLFNVARQHPGALILTPHAGEFARLFPEIGHRHALSKLEKAKQAAELAQAVVVYKGADTVIAEPTGKAAINTTGTSWLATAGTGDVLAGIVASQLAQGTASFEAACIAVWMHGRAAELFGPGLIAEDIPDLLPRVHAELERNSAGGKLYNSVAQA